MKNILVEMGSVCSKHGEMRIVYNISDENSELKSPLGRPGCRWKNSIKKKQDVRMWTRFDWLMNRIAGS
jgi:hypothetical protein